MKKLLALLLLTLSGIAFAAPPGVFNINNSQQSGQSTLTAPAPLYTDALVLSANTAQTQNVPAGAAYAVFSGACNFFVQRNGVAVVPVASSTNGNAPQQNPAAWYLNNGETSFSVIAASTCIVTVSFYTQ